MQVSAGSQAPAGARQTAPPLPAGCWQATLAPLHWSAEQGLPSSVQVVPLGLRASAGHVVPVPVQVSAASHSPAADLQTVPAGVLASAGHAESVPVHVSAGSHEPAETRQIVPEFPAG